jgi:putative hydrolase of the HAD superfamily
VKKPNNYKCVFFDLDHTLWDYDTNAKETLHELYVTYDLPGRGIDDIIRQERFKQILEPFNAFEHSLCETLTTDYLATCPQKCNLMPGTIDTLEYLADHYNLTIITNGFEEIQHMKLCAGKLQHYFDHVITSQKAGHRKPARQIFDYALKLNNIGSTEAIMIGDNPVTDIGGARNASIDAVLFNPEKMKYDVVAHYEISALAELRSFL